MKVALGLKAHSGWAAFVVIGKLDDDLVVVDRRRVELVNEEWQKQPYHAAEHMKANSARDLVARGIKVAQRKAEQEVRAAIKREQHRGNEITACAVLVGEPMPDWNTAEILAVHFRMHKAEGVLFRDVLVRAGEASGLRVVPVPLRQLLQHTEKALRVPAGRLIQMVTTLGKSVGAPWGKDQKEAVLAALVALQSVRK
jgi:hypothetical protein